MRCHCQVERVDAWLYPSYSCWWRFDIHDGGDEEKSGRWWTAAIITWNCQHWPESLLCWLRTARANLCQHDNRLIYMYILQWASVSSTQLLVGTGLPKNRPHDRTADRTVGRRRQCVRPHRRPHRNAAEKFSYLFMRISTTYCKQLDPCCYVQSIM